MKKNYIVIPVHNQLDYLKKCVSSIEKFTRDYEMVIVDDGSTDIQTTEWIVSHVNSYKIINPVATGFSKACNSGISFVKDNFDYNFICLLNSDTEIIIDDWLNVIEREISNISNPGVGSVVSNNAGYQTIADVAEYLKDIEDRETYECTLAHGFCFIMTKNAIDKIGFLDEINFPHYGSEDDYALSSSKKGLSNFLVSKILVLHHASASYTSERRKELVGKSYPDLVSKWTRNVVQAACEEMDCIREELNSNIASRK